MRRWWLRERRKRTVKANSGMLCGSEDGEARSVKDHNCGAETFRLRSAPLELKALVITKE